MEVINNLTKAFASQENPSSPLHEFQSDNWKTFAGLGLPAIKHEEWKYTRIRNAYADNLVIATDAQLSAATLSAHQLPGTDHANRIVFLNGRYQAGLSSFQDDSASLVVKPLETAAGDEDAEFVNLHLGHSQKYHPDGINALNAAFAAGGVYIRVNKGKSLNQPIVIYHFTDSSNGYAFSQPRILVNAAEASAASIMETYVNIGGGESLTNEVIEICAAQDAVLHYVKIQNEGANSSHSGTTHIRQLGKCLTHAVTLTLSGKMVRNNLNMVMEAEHGESHMYGLYLLNGDTLADNHTIVDNAMPHCFSNELYKGILDEQSTGVFNGKIFVRKDAQKTNAYQSNKNILLGDHASANTKPQLEIFADDVKCSHGCTIGKLDEDALFYLKARGISEQKAKALLLHAFAIDILDQIQHEAIREYADKLISERLSFDF
jgi:Fe-S cluster assembly protein SufD